MPSIKAIEGLAEVAAEAAGKILPSRLQGVTEALSSKAGLGARSLEKNPSAGGVLEPMTITDRAAFSSVLNGEQAKVLKANESLVGSVTDMLPQVQNGKLDWILGGSAATNALAGSRRLTFLDSSKLPAIVPTRIVELSNPAVNGFEGFVRRVGDVDAFVVNGGKNKFLGSPYLGAIQPNLPESAHAALTHVGEFRSSALVQGVKMEFARPEVAAIEYAGKTVFVTGPGQLLGNKMRQVMMSYSPSEAAKMTGDFTHLLDAAANIYTEKALLRFGRDGLQRNGLLYKHDVTLPWERSADNAQFLDYLRAVLESEGRNGRYLKGLNIEATDMVNAMRLFAKHPHSQDKAAMAGFINKHMDSVRSMDLRGSAERTWFLQQGGSGKATNTFMTMLDNMPASKQAGNLAERLQVLDTKLKEGAALPALAKVLRTGS